ncbi:hypothetical protein ACH5RR_024732 [Cinchona calisaya]|uniref:Uncharacterized protein n=1 Tax=Cinchona calisaya TaxID=153742 RepID=A0ABD2YXK4_9GENT
MPPFVKRFKLEVCHFKFKSFLHNSNKEYRFKLKNSQKLFYIKSQRNSWAHLTQAPNTDLDSGPQKFEKENKYFRSIYLFFGTQLLLPPLLSLSFLFLPLSLSKNCFAFQFSSIIPEFIVFFF